MSDVTVVKRTARLHPASLVSETVLMCETGVAEARTAAVYASLMVATVYDSAFTGVPIPAVPDLGMS